MTTSKDEYKVDSKRITKAIATAAATYSTDYTPDESYQEIVGVCVFENSSGGMTNGYYRTGVKDENKAYAELAHKSLLQSSSSVQQDKKFMPINIPIRKNRAIQCMIELGEAVSGSAFDVEFCFLLKRTVTAQS